MDKNNLNESNKDTFHFHLGYMHMAFYRRHLKSALDMFMLKYLFLNMKIS